MPIARVRDIEICYALGGHGPAPAENWGHRRRPAATADRFRPLPGRHDTVATPHAQRRLAERISGAGYREFEGYHLFFVQDPTAAPMIVEALASAPDQQKVMPPAQPGAVSPADGAGDTALRRT